MCVAVAVCFALTVIVGVKHNCVLQRVALGSNSGEWSNTDHFIGREDISRRRSTCRTVNFMYICMYTYTYYIYTHVHIYIHTISQRGDISRRRSTWRTTSSIAWSTSSSVVKRPNPKRILVCAMSSSTPVCMYVSSMSPSCLENTMTYKEQVCNVLADAR